VKTKITVLFFAAIVLSAAAGDAGSPPQTYLTGFNVALQRGNDLYDALPPKFGKQLAPQPVVWQAQPVPRISPVTSNYDNKILRQVSISAGFIGLANHLSHAKAIDRIQPGFFDQYVQNLGRVVGEDFSVQPPNITPPRFWADDIINDQVSYFNQMVSVMMAINLSHHYLGHFAKYSPQMAGRGNQTIPINDLLTPAEWEMSVKAGATDALNCALATDGARALFDAIDKIPRRPAWTEAIVPKRVDLKKLNKKLASYETEFFRGGLKFGLRDKLQFLPAGEQSPLISLAEKTCNGGPAFLAVVQRPMIDIHADELIGQIPAHVPGVVQGVSHSFGAMVKTKLDAAGQNPGND
jgi:hypothetical protein